MLLSISPIKYNNVSSSYPAFGKSRNTKSDDLRNTGELLYAQLENFKNAIALYDKICGLNTEIGKLKIQFMKEIDESEKLRLAKIIEEKISELSLLIEQFKES